jgi:hypothetical protein
MSKLSLIVLLSFISTSSFSIENCYKRNAMFFHLFQNKVSSFHANYKTVSPISLDFGKLSIPEFDLTKNSMLKATIVTQGKCRVSCRAKYVSDLIIAFPLDSGNGQFQSSKVKQVDCKDYF